MLAATAPFYDVLGDVSLWMHVSCVLLFWLAWVLVANAVQSQGPRCLALRCMALSVFFLSFTLNSLLVFFYAVATAFFLLRTRGRPFVDRCAQLLKTVLRWPDFIALPIVFWIWKSICTPTSGYYENYNKPNFATDHLLQGLALTVQVFLAPTSVELFTPVSWALAAAIAGGLIGYRLVSRLPQLADGEANSPISSPLLGFCGLILFLGAAFPYVVVGQPIASYGWWSRNAILMPLPISMLSVAVAIGLTGRLHGRPKAWFVVTAILTGLFASASVRNYLAMQGFGVKQLSIRHRLRDVIDDCDPAVIQLRDYSFMSGVNEGYPPSIWTYIASDLRERPRTFVVETRQLVPDTLDVDAIGQRSIRVGAVTLDREILEAGIKATGMPYALGNIPRTGGQALLVLQTGSQGIDARQIGAEYIRRRWLAPSSLPKFFDSVVSATALPLPALAE